MLFRSFKNRKTIQQYREQFRAGPIGFWYTYLGGNAEITHGTDILFRADGSGNLETWGFGEREEGDFLWRSVGDRTILIDHENKSTEVNYDFFVRKSDYGSCQVCIFQPQHWAKEEHFGESGFWISVYPLVHHQESTS